MQKGQIKVILGIILALGIVGGVVAWQFLGGEEDKEAEGTSPFEEEVSQETPQKKGGFFSNLFGSSQEAEEKEPSSGGGFFSNLFGGGSGGETEEQEGGGGFFSNLFGSGSSQQESSQQPSGGGFFSNLFGGSGGSEKDDKVGTETESAESAAPKRSNASPLGDLPYYTKKTEISLKTDKIATCRYSTTKGARYGTMKIFDKTNSTSHSTEVTGLSEGGEYKYYVKCQDLEGNTNETDFIVAFEVKEPEDTTPPERRNAYPLDEVFSASTEQVAVGVGTNEPATCRYDEEAGTSYNSMSHRFSYYDDTKQYHIDTITSLEPGKYYQYFIRCKDMDGNVNTGDVMISFRIAE